jgi:hypothetical protein
MSHAIMEVAAWLMSHMSITCAHHAAQTQHAIASHGHSRDDLLVQVRGAELLKQNADQ